MNPFTLAAIDRAKEAEKEYSSKDARDKRAYEALQESTKKKIKWIYQRDDKRNDKVHVGMKK